MVVGWEEVRVKKIEKGLGVAKMMVVMMPLRGQDRGDGRRKISLTLTYTHTHTLAPGSRGSIWTSDRRLPQSDTTSDVG